MREDMEISLSKEELFYYLKYQTEKFFPDTVKCEHPHGYF